MRAVFRAGRKFFGSPVNRGVEGVEIGAGLEFGARDVLAFCLPRGNFWDPLRAR